MYVVHRLRHTAVHPAEGIEELGSPPDVARVLSRVLSKHYHGVLNLFVHSPLWLPGRRISAPSVGSTNLSTSIANEATTV